MKILLIFLIMIAFVFFALFVYLYYFIRVKLYKDLIFVCEYIINNISFNKDTLDKLFANCIKDLSYTTKFILYNYQNSDMKLIKKADKENIDKFISSLGVGDVDYENKNLDYFKTFFVSLENVASDEFKKKGLVYFKLIILLGIALTVLIL